ncbi:MAG: Uncharacterized protein XD78_1385 [Desulfotomaculum sp. 46_296]|nr:MAG: Uncharacterized protein XD78_1385 [Desulfotomaculum sp. 46_296]
MENGDNKKDKKQILLRLSPSLWKELAAWAEDDFRSINGQIEYLLSECVKQRRKSRTCTLLTFPLPSKELTLARPLLSTLSIQTGEPSSITVMVSSERNIWRARSIFITNPPLFFIIFSEKGLSDSDSEIFC